MCYIHCINLITIILRQAARSRMALCYNMYTIFGTSLVQYTELPVLVYCR